MYCVLRLCARIRVVRVSVCVCVCVLYVNVYVSAAGPLHRLAEVKWMLLNVLFILKLLRHSNAATGAAGVKDAVTHSTTNSVPWHPYDTPPASHSWVPQPVRLKATPPQWAIASIHYRSSVTGGCDLS